jgi:hypothetical protein
MIQFENGSTTALQSSTCKYTRGFHELIIENKDGWTGKKSFAVLKAAAFFTPNGDGAND